MTQHTKILNVLENGAWHCTSEMYALYIADPRTRLAELKKQGYELVSRWCEAHKHDGQMKEWRLLSRSTWATTTKDTCPKCHWFMNHNPSCPTLKEKELTGQLKF